MTLSRNESYQKNNYKKFTNFTSIYNMRLGLKKVNCISLLPTKVEALYYSLMIWIFRVIGGISTILLITKKLDLFINVLVHPRHMCRCWVGCALGDVLSYNTSLYVCFVICVVYNIYNT